VMIAIPYSLSRPVWLVILPSDSDWMIENAV
jgi:hypothetical protein